MCQYEKCTAEAYKASESVLLETFMLCPKCAHQIHDSGYIHFGGEQWQPTIKCPNCEWNAFLWVKPKTLFMSRKDPVPAAAEPGEAAKEPVSYEERRIWWQDEVDRQVAKLSGWEPMTIWRGVYIGDLAPERKRAIAAGIEHALEQARTSEAK